MPLTLKSFPAWAPEVLKTLYLSRQEEQQDCSNDLLLEKQDCSNDLLLEKFVSDPRMESVWKSITKRSNDENYPLHLFVILSLLTSYEEPKESPAELKKRYSLIEDLARQLETSMKDSIFERQGVISIVSGIAESAGKLARSVETSFMPFISVMARFDMEYPIRTMLARKLHRIFKNDLNTPLWATTARIIEVVCDVPPGEIDAAWIRSCVLGGVKLKN